MNFKLCQPIAVALLESRDPVTMISPSWTIDETDGGSREVLGEGRSLQLGGGARTMKRPKCHSPGDVGRRIFGGARFSKVFVFLVRFSGACFSRNTWNFKSLVRFFSGLVNSLLFLVSFCSVLIKARFSQSCVSLSRKNKPNFVFKLSPGTVGELGSLEIAKADFVHKASFGVCLRPCLRYASRFH